MYLLTEQRYKKQAYTGQLSPFFIYRSYLPFVDTEGGTRLIPASKSSQTRHLCIVTNNKNEIKMKKFSTLLLLAFFSTLAFANPSTPSNDDTASTEQEIIVTPVGFDKVLSMIVFDNETSNVEIELSQNTVGMVYKTTMRTTDSEVIEMDSERLRNRNLHLESSSWRLHHCSDYHLTLIQSLLKT